MTSTKQEPTAEQKDAAADAAALNQAQSEKLATYVQLTDGDAQVPNAIQHLVFVGRLAYQEKISVGAFQEVLDAIWLYGAADAAAIIGAEVAPPIISATGATEGAPGAFTPEGCVIPADAAALAGILANPQTLWAEGNHVVTVDAALSHWDGTAWAAGAAPAPIVEDEAQATKKKSTKK